MSYASLFGYKARMKYEWFQLKQIEPIIVRKRGKNIE